MRVSLLVNPRSGGVDDPEGLERLLEGAGATVARFGLDELPAALEAAPDRLVVAGGDGSIAPVAAAVAERGLELAVLPAGTGNDFARAMGIPLEIEEAVRIAAAGRAVREVDLALMDGRPFLNAASAGLAVHAADASRSLKRVLGPLAYAAGGALAAWRAAPLRCRVVCDGEELYHGRAWQVMVANSGHFGAGAQVETADPADRRLDAVVLELGPRRRLARYAYGLRRGAIVEQPGVHRRAAAKVAVEAPEDTAYNVDGELVRSGSAAFSLLPRAVRLVVGTDADDGEG